MIELTVLNVIHIIACMLMVFFWGNVNRRRGRNEENCKRTLVFPLSNCMDMYFD